MFCYFRFPVGWFEILKRTVRGAIDDDCLGLAAQLAFFFFLALFPALIFGVALLGFLPIESAIPSMLDRLASFAPGQVVAIVERQLRYLTADGSPKLLTIGMIGAVWSSSAAVMSIIEALNKVYEIKESRPWWRVRILSILLTLGLIVSFLIALALVMIGPQVARFLDARLHLGAALITAWNLFGWIGAFLLAAFAVDIIYRFGPDAETRWVWVTPGSLLATVLWIASSLGFKTYVAHSGAYNVTYGAIGGVIVLMLWFYISGLSILIGAEVDAKIDEAFVEKRNIIHKGGRKKIGAALESC